MQTNEADAWLSFHARRQSCPVYNSLGSNLHPPFAPRYQNIRKAFVVGEEGFQYVYYIGSTLAGDFYFVWYREASIGNNP